MIVTCPCALSLATPAATLAAAGALARRGVMVRRLEGLEAAAAVDTIVFDKTGTLTQDRMSVMAVAARPGHSADEVLGLAAALASQSLHPVSRALAASAPPTGWRAEAVREHAGQGLEGQVAAETGGPVLPLRLGSAAFCGVTPDAGAAGAQVHLAGPDGWLASFTLDEALREDAAAAVAELRRRGLEVELLSGDHDRAVQRLAARAGISAGRGDCSPADKLGHVSRLQDQGHRVAMVGDGINDGPVLARAHLSVAMAHGAPLAQARSDVVVLGNRLSALPALLLQARRTRRVVRQNLAWAAAYNAVCVPLAVAGAMPAWLAGLGMAASSLAVVLNAARLARIDLPGEPPARG